MYDDALSGIYFVKVTNDINQKTINTGYEEIEVRVTVYLEGLAQEKVKAEKHTYWFRYQKNMWKLLSKKTFWKCKKGYQKHLFLESPCKPISD